MTPFCIVEFPSAATQTRSVPRAGCVEVEHLPDGLVALRDSVRSAHPLVRAAVRPGVVTRAHTATGSAAGGGEIAVARLLSTSAH